MSQTLMLKVKGLHLHNNQFSEVPIGALSTADNIVIDRDSVAESRRGQKTYGEPVASGNGTAISRLFSYRDHLFTQTSGTLYKDNDEAGTWVALSGSHFPPSDEVRSRGISIEGSLFLTTSGGVKKLDQVEGQFVIAGVDRALGGSTELSGATGFLPISGSVAHRLVWGYEDANQKEIIGSPSQRLITYNSDLQTRNVSLIWDVPTSITPNYFWRLYRSTAAIGLEAVPEDELQLVKEGNPTSQELADRFFTVLDDTPSALRGADLYTNPSQESILKANDPPPRAEDIVSYLDLTLYANTLTKHRYFSDLLTVGDDFHYITYSGNAESGSATISGIPSTTTLRAGMVVSGTGIVPLSKINSVPSSTAVVLDKAVTQTFTNNLLSFHDVFGVGGQEYYASSGTNTNRREFFADTTGTPATNIETTALSLVQTVNRNVNNTNVYAYYVSGDEDNPGMLLFEERLVGGNAFSIYSSAGDAWSPTLPVTAGTELSSNETKINRIYISKPGLPEAVPALNFKDVGSADAAILRILALRQAIMVLKTDGVFRITGNDITNLTIDPFDSSTLLRGRDTAVVLNNMVICYTDQGVVSIGDNGVTPLSRNIESTLQELSSDLFPDFDKMSFGVPYESDRKYILFTPVSNVDVYPRQAWVYNYFTQSWTRWDLARSAGIVNPRNDKLYLSNPINGFIYEERKTFTRLDYADEQYNVTITVVSGTSLTLSKMDNVVEDYTIVQGSKEAQIDTVTDGSNTIAVSRDLLWQTGSAVLYKPILSEIQWVPITADNPGIVKHFREITLIFRDASFDDIQMGFSSNFSPTIEVVTLEPKDLGGAWGEGAWGESPWGAPIRGSQTIRTFVPLDHQRCSWINFNVSLRQAFTKFSLEGISTMYENMSSRFT